MNKSLSSIKRPAPNIYTAGPIAGCDFNGAVDWRNWTESQLPECNVLSPMRGKEFLRQLNEFTSQPEQYAEIATRAVDAAITSQHAIVVRDHWDVESADVLIVNLLPSLNVGKASIGTMFELAWAWRHRKPAIVAMQAEGNPNDHPFVREAAYITVETLEEVIFVARQLLNLPPRPVHDDAGNWMTYRA